MDLLRLWLSGVRIAFATRLANRFDFFASLLVMIGVEFLPTLAVALVYGSGRTFPGWTLPEALLVQGVFLLAKGVAYPIVGGIVWNTAEMVRDGSFELLLLKPRHPLLLCIVRGFDPEDVGKFFGGAALCAWCLSRTGIPDGTGIALFAALLLTSVTLFVASLVAMSAILIVWVGNFRVYELFDCIAYLGQFPPSILPPKLRALLVAPFPVLGFAIFPACALLGRSTAGWPWIAASTAFFLVAAYFLWNTLSRRLVGAGG